ncbi:hypothetical protein Tco_1435464 [Tanacetum coccineum]
MAKTINGEAQLYALVDGKKIIIIEAFMRRDLRLEDEEGIDYLPNSTIFEQLALMGYEKTTAWNEFSSTVASAIICLATNQKFNFSKFIFGDVAVHKELGDRLVRAATIASSLKAEQDSGNITKTRSKATPNESSFLEQDSGNITKTRSKATPNESSFLGTTSGGGPRCQEAIGDTIAQTRFENVSKHSNDLLLARVLDLEKTKTTQDSEIASLKRRARSLKRKIGSEEVFVAGQNKNVVEEVVDVAQVSTAATTVTITTEEIILAQALEALKTSKPKVQRIVFQEPGKSTTTTTISSQQSQDKGKRIMIEEPVKSMKKKDQISIDEKTAKKLQAEFDEEERLAGEKAKKEN